MPLMEELSERKEKVDVAISKIFEKEEHPLWEHMAYYPEAGGKKLRPFLVMITTGAFETEENKAIPYGVALELVHNFTLVHDDIMDKDEKRRGKETLYKKIGEAQAINTGDGLFALAFNELSRIDTNGEKLRTLLNELSTSVIKVAEGQQEDISFESTFDISEKEFIGMIEKKTSYLFRAATRGGAIIGGASDKQIDEMGEYARKMGIAFQIQDDYLDLIGDEEKIGKDSGSDIREGKRTLLVIKALSELPSEKEERLKMILKKEENTPEEIDEAIDLFQEAGSIDYSKDLAEKYAEEAKSHLQSLPNSEYKNLLEEVVDFMISRSR